MRVNLSSNCVPGGRGPDPAPLWRTAARPALWRSCESHSLRLPRLQAGTEHAPPPLPGCAPLQCSEPLPPAPLRSGCVTSAEAVLLEQQSVAECLARLRSPLCSVAVTLSPQARASIAARLGVSPAEAHARLAALFLSLGAAAVLDASLAREIALAEAAADFVSRFRAASSPGAETSSPPPPLPVLCSACPGWVCYAEKTHGQLLVPHLSSACSPQAVAGVLAKRLGLLAAAPLGAAPCHVAVMPCPDKKLEAARSQLAGPGGPQTDLVLTAAEVMDLAAEVGADLARPAAELWGRAVSQGAGGAGQSHGDAAAELLDPAVTAVDSHGALWGAEDSGGSGGYAEAAAAAAATQLLAPGTVAAPLRWTPRPGCGADFAEATLGGGAPGEATIRLARVYGFRSIQTLVRQIRLRSCPYHYVVRPPAAVRQGLA